MGRHQDRKDRADTYTKDNLIDHLHRWPITAWPRRRAWGSIRAKLLTRFGQPDSRCGLFHTAGRRHGSHLRAPGRPTGSLWRTPSRRKPTPAKQCRSWPPRKWIRSSSGWMIVAEPSLTYSRTLSGDHRRSAQKRPARCCAHLLSGRRQGSPARRSRRIRARRPRQRYRRRIHAVDQGATQRLRHPESSG